MRFQAFDLGLIDFITAWNYQRAVFHQVKQDELDSAIIFCRHNPVITLGRGADKSHIKAGQEELTKLNIPIYEIDRGGDVTYHGPGQVCIYPILNLSYFKKDINWYLRTLEQIIIKLLSGFKITANAVSGLTGVWYNNKKIASIGIGIKSWITYHGISLNVKKDDLSNFSLIRPCGLDIEMISMESITGTNLSYTYIYNYCRHFILPSCF